LESLDNNTFQPPNMNYANIIEAVQRDGYAVMENVIGHDDLKAMQQAFDRQIEHYEAHFDASKINENELGTLRCIISLDQAFLPLAAVQPVMDVAQELLGDYLYYSFNGFYTTNRFTHPTTLFHRDVPLFTPEVMLSLNLLYCLDDTTTENGATWFVPGSHLLRNRPSDDYIETHKKQVTMKAGSVLLFNSLTFHASGINHNGGQRRCIANVLRKSFMKPQFQWDQILGGNGFAHHLSEESKKRFGFYNNPAPSLEAYYQEGIRRRAEREQRGVKTVYGIELKDI
jgi:ectoine hydroxylase-related dioxygenase (phytanoyl-CoA dioxygenase family)